MDAAVCLVRVVLAHQSAGGTRQSTVLETLSLPGH